MRNQILYNFCILVNILQSSQAQNCTGVGVQYQYARVYAVRNQVLEFSQLAVYDSTFVNNVAYQQPTMATSVDPSSDYSIAYPVNGDLSFRQIMVYKSAQSDNNPSWSVTWTTPVSVAMIVYYNSAPLNGYEYFIELGILVGNSHIAVCTLTTDPTAPGQGFILQCKLVIYSCL